jgi:glycine cleavage system aminomethyltransferase T
VITSGTRSPVLHEIIALCRMAIEYSEIGTEAEAGN